MYNFGSRIYVFGDINQSFFLAQLDKEGVLVPTFGSEGKVIIQFGASLSYGLKMKLYTSVKLYCWAQGKIGLV
jgi:hypothetical protein